MGPVQTSAFREGQFVSRRDRVTLGRLSRHREPADASARIGREARLAVLAVIDKVDAELDLLFDYVGNGPAHGRRQLFTIIRIAGVLRAQRRYQLWRTWQATAMGSENSTGAELHCPSLAAPAANA
jgi:hypothetical protein